MRVPVLVLLLNVFEIGYSAVWICMVISNFGAVIMGMILYTRIDFKPKINKMHQKIKQEIARG